MKRGALALLATVVAGCGGGGGPAVDTVETEVASDAVGRTLPLRIVVPEGGGAGRPLLVFLHGRGVSAGGHVGDGFREAYAALGERAPVVAFPYGGESSYWHDRADGDWGRYVVDEVIPQALERTGADERRVALGGISMGGFGALDLASRGLDGLCAVGAHSPAIWQSAGETAAGAFDDAEDFAAHDVIARAGRLRGIPLWVDIGEDDPFRPGAQGFADAAGARLRVFDGGHEGGYWDAHWPDYLRFYAGACN